MTLATSPLRCACLHLIVASHHSVVGAEGWFPPPLPPPSLQGGREESPPPALATTSGPAPPPALVHVRLLFLRPHPPGQGDAGAVPPPLRSPLPWKGACLCVPSVLSFMSPLSELLPAFDSLPPGPGLGPLTWSPHTPSPFQVRRCLSATPSLPPGAHISAMTQEAASTAHGGRLHAMSSRPSLPPPGPWGVTPSGGPCQGHFPGGPHPTSRGPGLAHTSPGECGFHHRTPAPAARGGWRAAPPPVPAWAGPASEPGGWGRALAFRDLGRGAEIYLYQDKTKLNLSGRM